MELAVDRLGFVLAPSTRQLTLSRLDELLREVPPSLNWVAVLVDPTESLIEALLERGCRTLQFHGAESPEFCRRFLDRACVVKAFRLRSASDLERLLPYRSCVHELLLDGASPGAGQPFSWDWLQQRPPLPFYLAGGLCAENVEQAVRQLRPEGVDVSSGVESQPGHKDPDRLRRFVERTRSIE